VHILHLVQYVAISARIAGLKPNPFREDLSPYDDFEVLIRPRAGQGSPPARTDRTVPDNCALHQTATYGEAYQSGRYIYPRWARTQHQQEQLCQMRAYDI